MALSTRGESPHPFFGQIPRQHQAHHPERPAYARRSPPQRNERREPARPAETAAAKGGIFPIGQALPAVASPCASPDTAGYAHRLRQHGKPGTRPGIPKPSHKKQPSTTASANPQSWRTPVPRTTFQKTRRPLAATRPLSDLMAARPGSHVAAPGAGRKAACGRTRGNSEGPHGPSLERLACVLGPGFAGSLRSALRPFLRRCGRDPPAGPR